MNCTSVQLENGSRVLLLENFFPTDWVIKLVGLIDEFTVDNPDWTNPPEFGGRPRYVYTGNSPVYLELETYLRTEKAEELGQLVNNKIKFIDYKLWVDLPGLGRLTPHLEAWGDYLGQIYITRQEHPYNGTTIYNDNKQILFQMPYRNNYGWFFDQCQRVWHGRKFDVAEQLVRASVMLWYNNE